MARGAVYAAHQQDEQGGAEDEDQDAEPDSHAASALTPCAGAERSPEGPAHPQRRAGRPLETRAASYVAAPQRPPLP